MEKNSSYAAHLRGSFGSGWSRFPSVVHVALNGEPTTRASGVAKASSRAR
ncbi:hypothetical protein [Streptomyces sp. NBC_00525]|nr:hypothetical protein [Streptomyces sp. NBC_00525]WUC92522.1 hypothetical protein OG710_02385 [Streptomyces sp. NBC_00525]